MTWAGQQQLTVGAAPAEHSPPESMLQPHCAFGTDLTGTQCCIHLWSDGGSVLQHAWLAILPCSLQHSHRSQIIIALILAALKLGVIWSAEYCHQLAHTCIKYRRLAHTMKKQMVTGK